MEWRLAESPMFVAAEGGGEPLHGISGAFLDRRDRLIIANGGAHEIVAVHLTDPGSPLVFGAEGRGPGEFATLTAIHAWQGDSILALDSELRRVTLFAPDGGVAWVRDFPDIGSPPGVLATTTWPAVLGAFGDGSVLLRSAPYLNGHGADSDTAYVQLFRWIPTYAIVDTLNTPIPWMEVARQGGRLVGPHFRAEATEVPVHDEAFVTGLGRGPALVVYGTDGNVLRHMEVRTDTQQVNDAVLGAYRDWLLARVPETAQDAISRRFDATPVAAQVPLFDRLLFDELGRIWIQIKGDQVQHYELDKRDPKKWQVHGEHGLIGVITSPGPYQIVAIRNGMVVGIWRDTDGVETVRVYELQDTQ
ncbi:MAG: hypothetical protein ACREL7_14295 [Longimicrobiales bacterium]